MTDDSELLRCYLATHSETAFSDLVERYFNLVFFAALRQVGGDPHLARDVAQVVFTDLARKAPTLVDRPTLAGWLYSSTRFAAIHSLRAERRRQQREQEGYAMQSLLSDSEAAIEWDRLKPVIDDILHELSKDDREAVLMRFFQGKPFPEIGTSLGISPDAARFRLDRILARMRTALSKKGVTSTSTALGLALTFQATAAPPVGMAATVAALAFSEAAIPAGVATSAGLFKFMATAKASVSATIVLLGAAAAGEAVFAWVQTRELAALNSERYDVSESGGNLGPQSSLQAVPRSNSNAAGAVSVSVQQASDEPKTSAAIPPKPKTAATNAQTGAANPSQAFSVAMQDPEFRKLLATAEKARLNLFYGSLFKSLNLGADQLDRFKELLVDKQQSVGDANRSALGAGLDPDAAKGLIVNGQEEINSDLRSLLGDAGYVQYQRFEATRGQRMVVEQLQSSLSYSRTPLTDDQASQLVDLLYQNSPPRNPPATAGLGAQFGAGIRERDLSAPISAQMVLAAQGLLNLAQLDALTQIQQQQQERTQIAQNLKRLSSAAH